MNSVFGHCHDSFWTVQFGGFCEFGSRSSGAQRSELELIVDNWSSRLIIGAHGWELELTVQIWSTRFTFWSSRFGFGAHGSTGKNHDLLFLGMLWQGFLGIRWQGFLGDKGFLCAQWCLLLSFDLKNRRSP